jgi:hypothetical protein
MRAALLIVLAVSLLSFALLRNLFPGRGGEAPAGLFGMIEALGIQWPFTTDAVSRITKATLRETGSNEYFATFKSAGGLEPPLREVELRLPVSAKAKNDGILILSIDAGARITPKAVRERFGPEPEFSVPEPAAPYGFVYSYSQAWARLSFAFARGTESLVSVSLNALEPRFTAAGEKWLDTFPAYPGARELCSQHVTGREAHILWTAYATGDPPKRVTAFYMQAAEGKEHAEQSGGTVSFRHGDRVLAIHPAAAKDYPECGLLPGLKDKTVLIVSQLVRG